MVGGQEIRVEDGFAHALRGADLHVFADGVPVYMLDAWRPPPAVDTAWLRELPSRMLNARHAVVDFVGREHELGALSQWLQGGSRLAVRWVHGPGGQGKTRLVDEFASRSLLQGWKVVTVTHGPGSILESGVRDMGTTDARGLLVIVDYADRWPLSHVKLLFANSLFHRTGLATRVVLISRTADEWPLLRLSLDRYQADVSVDALASLPTNTWVRQAMFDAARRAFARRYGIADTLAIEPHGPLESPDFALTLAVHMSALVSVDAYAHGRRLPRDLAGLTVYLLDRERLHWRRLYGDGHHEVAPSGRTYSTHPDVMNQTVFAAALVGPVPPAHGAAVVGNLRFGLTADRVLADHTRCYPPSDPVDARVLEPLYPDRLAEDFLALTVPGHAADYTGQPWASPTAERMLMLGREHRAPAYASRALVFLASATARWPHLGRDCLYPLLLGKPALAGRGGSAALTALADIPDVDLDVLARVEASLAADETVDLAAGCAAVSRRLAPHRLGATDDPFVHAEVYANLARRFEAAGYDDDACAAAEAHLSIWRRLAEEHPGQHDSELAAALNIASNALSDIGRHRDALHLSEEAVALRRAQFACEPGAYAANLAVALGGLGNRLGTAGDWSAAVACLREAVMLFDALPEPERVQYRNHVASSLSNLGGWLAQIGEYDEALATTERALAIERQLTSLRAEPFAPELVLRLNNLGARLLDTGRLPEALHVASEAVTVARQLVAVNRPAHEGTLALAVSNLSIFVAQSDDTRKGDLDRAIELGAEAVAICRRRADDNRAAHGPELQRVLNNLCNWYIQSRYSQEALDTARESVLLARRMSAANPTAYIERLAKALLNLSLAHQGMERDPDRMTRALAAADEAHRIYVGLQRQFPVKYGEDLALADSIRRDIRKTIARHAEQARRRSDFKWRRKR